MRNNNSDMRQEEDGLIDRVVEINRVSKVVKGGRRFSFSALVVVGALGAEQVHPQRVQVGVIDRVGVEEGAQAVHAAAFLIAVQRLGEAHDAVAFWQGNVLGEQHAGGQCGGHDALRWQWRVTRVPRTGTLPGQELGWRHEHLRLVLDLRVPDPGRASCASPMKWLKR